MTKHPICVEVVRVRPLPGQRDAVLALRPRFEIEFRRATPGFISQSWYELEDGVLLDIALWESQDALEAVDEDQPILEEWYGLLEIESMEIGTSLDG